MKPIIVSLLATALLTVAVAACAPGTGIKEGPAGQPSSTDVNPITGSRGGTNR